MGRDAKCQDDVAEHTDECVSSRADVRQRAHRVRLLRHVPL